MSGCRNQVAAGRLNAAFVDAARQVARRVTATRPTPTGTPRWSEEEIDDLVQAAIARTEPARIVAAANGAASDREFEGWLRAVMRRELYYRASRTPAGQVLRAVDDALREDPDRFTLDHGHWRLADDTRQPDRYAEREQLLAAAWAIETRTVHISPDAEKTPPIAYRPDLRAVCAAMLELAGPMAKRDLGELVAYRFNAQFASRFDYLDCAGHQPLSRDGPGDVAEVDDRAAGKWMFGQLTGEERQVIRILAAGGGVRAIAEELGCGRTKAAVIRTRLAAKVRRLAELTGDDDLGATAHLAQLAGHQEELRSLVDHDGDLHGV